MKEGRILRSYQADESLDSQLMRLAIVKKSTKSDLINRAIAHLVQSEASNLPLHAANFVYDGLEVSA